MADQTIRFVLEGDQAGGAAGAGPQQANSAAPAPQAAANEKSLIRRLTESAVVTSAAMAIAHGVGKQVIESTGTAIAQIFKKAAADVEQARAAGGRASFLGSAFDEARRRATGQVAGASGIASNIAGDVSGAVGRGVGMGLDALEKRLPEVGGLLGARAAESLTDGLTSIREAIDESGGLMGSAGGAAMEGALEALRGANLGGVLGDAIYESSLEASRALQQGFARAWSGLRDVLRMVPDDIEALAAARDRALVSMSSAEMGLNRESWPTRGEPDRGLAGEADGPINLDQEEENDRRAEELADRVRNERAAREAARALAERTRELAAARDRERYHNAEPPISFDNIDEVVAGEREARPRRPAPPERPRRPSRPSRPSPAAEPLVTPEIVPERGPAPTRGSARDWIAALAGAVRQGISGIAGAAGGVGGAVGGAGRGIFDRARELFNTPSELNRLIRGSLPFRVASSIGAGLGAGEPGSVTAAAAGLGALYVAARALSFGFGLLTSAVKGVWNALVWMDKKVMAYAEKIGDYSPDIASQRAGETVRTIQRRQQWAREDGAQVAAWMRGNEQLNVFMERIDRAVTAIVLDFGSLLDLVGRGLDIATANPELLKQSIWGLVQGFVGATFGPHAMLALSVLRGLAKWLGDEEAKTELDMTPLGILRRWGPLPVKYADVVYNPGGLPDLNLEGNQARGTTPGVTGNTVFNTHTEFW